MKINELTPEKLIEKTKPPKMFVITRGKGSPKKSKSHIIEINNPKIVIRHEQLYIHSNNYSKIKSFGSGTKIIFK